MGSGKAKKCVWSMLQFLFAEDEFKKVADNLRYPAKLEKTTVFCREISDSTKEIQIIFNVNGQEYTTYNYGPLFREPEGTAQTTNKGKRILIKNDRGIGKTSLARRLEWEWAKGDFKMFSIVFFVSLRLMKHDDMIENIILRQNEFLRKMRFNRCKLRKLLETFGEKCLLILDGWGEHTGACDDVIRIIQGHHLSNCSILVTSCPEFAAEDALRGSFNVVACCEGFPRYYAAKFAKNILSQQDQVQNILEFYATKDTLNLDKEGEPLYKNPLLFLFTCILINEIKPPVDIGELYFRIIHYLYRQFSFQEKVFSKDDKIFVTWMKRIGEIAFRYDTKRAI